MVLAEEVVASTNEYGLEYFVLAGGQASWPEVILLFWVSSRLSHQRETVVSMVSQCLSFVIMLIYNAKFNLLTSW